MSKIYKHFDQRYNNIMRKATSYWNKVYPECCVNFLDIFTSLEEKGLIKLTYVFDHYVSDKYLSNYDELDAKGEDLAKQLSEFFNCVVEYRTCTLCNVLAQSKSQFVYIFRFDKSYIDMIYSFLKMV